MLSGMSVIGNGGRMWSLAEIIVLLSPLILLVAYWCDLQLRNQDQKSIINTYVITAFKNTTPLLSIVLGKLKKWISTAGNYIIKLLKYLNE